MRRVQHETLATTREVCGGHASRRSTRWVCGLELPSIADPVYWCRPVVMGNVSFARDALTLLVRRSPVLLGDVGRHLRGEHRCRMFFGESGLDQRWRGPRA